MTPRVRLQRMVVGGLAALAAACATSRGANAPAAPPARPAPAASSTAAGAAKASPRAASEAPRLDARAQRLFEEAVAAYDDQKKLKVPIDWEALERRWRAVIDAEPVPEAYYNLGVVLERLRRPKDARAAYERALALKPGLEEAAANLAVLDEGGDSSAVAARYQELLRRFPDDAVARIRLAALYRANGQLDEAWRLAREALMRDPRAVGAYKVMMRVALERGNPDLAELIALRAQKLDERDPEIAFFVGQVIARRDDENAAIVQYKRALGEKDDFLAPRYELLRIALKKLDWSGVAEQAKTILKYEPNDPRAHLVLGIAERYLGHLDRAAAEYDAAEQLSGDKLPDVHLARGVLEMKSRNRCEPAIAEFKRYASAVGPAVAGDAPVFRLQRECEQILLANRQAEEAARQMKAEEERKKKEEADRKAAGEAQKRGAPDGAAAPEKPRPPPGNGAQPAGNGAQPPGRSVVPTAARGEAAHPDPRPVPAAEPADPEPPDPR